MSTLLRALLAFAALSLFVACDDEDPFAPPEPLYPPPSQPWRTDVQTVSTAGLPVDQRNLFVERNNMDTVMTSSGLIYQIDEPGGEDKPTVDSEIVVYYRGYLVDGRVFDQSTDGFPLGSTRTIRPSGLIEAWKEGIPKLGRGGRMWMVVKPSLGYGVNGSQSIPGNSNLVFELELVDFK